MSASLDIEDAKGKKLSNKHMKAWQFTRSSYPSPMLVVVADADTWTWQTVVGVQKMRLNGQSCVMRSDIRSVTVSLSHIPCDTNSHNYTQNIHIIPD